MKKACCILLLICVNSIIAQPLSYFKFTVPAHKSYDSTISFQSALGIYQKNDRGYYFVVTDKYIDSQSVYAVKNYRTIDTFRVGNLYKVFKFYINNQHVEPSCTLEWDSIKTMRDLHYKEYDEGQIIQEYRVAYASVLAHTNTFTNVKYYALQPKDEIILEEQLKGKPLVNDDIVIIDKILGFEKGKKNFDIIKLPGVYFRISNLNAEKAEKNALFAKDESISTLTTIHKPKSGYYFTGKTVNSSTATLSPTKTVDQNLVKIIQDAGIPGMTGYWKIYNHNGILFAHGSISYDIFTNTYSLNNDWVYSKTK